MQRLKKEDHVWWKFINSPTIVSQSTVAKLFTFASSSSEFLLFVELKFGSLINLLKIRYCRIVLNSYFSLFKWKLYCVSKYMLSKLFTTNIPQNSHLRFLLVITNVNERKLNVCIWGSSCLKRSVKASNIIGAVNEVKIPQNLIKKILKFFIKSFEDHNIFNILVETSWS